MDKAVLPATTYSTSQPILQAPLDRSQTVNIIEPDYDDLYEVTDDETEEVPLGCSESVAVTPTAARPGRYPSIIIPSPSEWPSIQKLQRISVSPLPTTKFLPVKMSPAVRSRLEAQSLTVPATSATPSLDGSMTSEEMADLSCPSTPDVAFHPDTEEQWDSPMQLNPEALQTLQQLSAELDLAPEEPVAEVACEPEHHEMMELAEGERRDSGIEILVTSGDQDEDEEEILSSLSIPSPGGFFSSLESTARMTWDSTLTEAHPSTSTAENFYGLPWVRSPIRETAPRTVISRLGSYEPSNAETVKEIGKTPFEYQDNYEQDILVGGTINIDRTTLWLQGQFTCPEPDVESDAASTLVGSPVAPSKRSVRFADEVESMRTVTPEPKVKVVRDSTFYRVFQNVNNKCKSTDAFVHRQARVEAVNMTRKCVSSSHRLALMGHQELVNPVRPSKSRPFSTFYQGEVDEQKDIYAIAEKEQQAREQMQESAWNLQAAKNLNGGKMLNSPAPRRAIRQSKKPLILDLGGQSTCDWAWQMALETPKATVYTVTDQPITSALRGPKNHRVASVPNLWTLPFPSDSFDLISARTLFALLKTDKQTDQYKLCLRECHRCLKPGGFLEYNLVDAELMGAGPRGQALSVEFGYNLKTRGYDANPTKTFIPRLYAAGFNNIQRAWLALPVARPMNSDAANRSAAEKVISPDGDVSIIARPVSTGSTAAASGVSGIVGAWSWEKWMLKLQLEMGKDEDRLLEGVGAALEEAGREGAAGWRCLTGWARK